MVFEENRFPSLSIFLINKKFEIEETILTIVISTFEADIAIVNLVFSISNFLLAKLLRQGSRVLKKIY